jgi:hypothetical protein
VNTFERVLLEIEQRDGVVTHAAIDAALAAEGLPPVKRTPRVPVAMTPQQVEALQAAAAELGAAFEPERFKADQDRPGWVGAFMGPAYAECSPTGEVVLWCDCRPDVPYGRCEMCPSCGSHLKFCKPNRCSHCGACGADCPEVCPGCLECVQSRDHSRC